MKTTKTEPNWEEFWDYYQGFCKIVEQAVCDGLFQKLSAKGQKNAYWRVGAFLRQTHWLKAGGGPLPKLGGKYVGRGVINPAYKLVAQVELAEEPEKAKKMREVLQKMESFVDGIVYETVKAEKEPRASKPRGMRVFADKIEADFVSLDQKLDKILAILEKE